MRNKIKSIIEKAYNNGKKNLNEVEVYEIFKLLNLNLPFYLSFDKSQCENVEWILDEIDKKINTSKIVLKIVSSTNLHKTDSGGVKIVNKVRKDIRASIEELKKIDYDLILAMEFIEHSPFSLGEEILLGAKMDEAYGPIITIAPGGTHTESFIKVLKREIAPSFVSVLNIKTKSDIEKFIDESWICNYCFGKVRGLKPKVNKDELLRWVDALSNLMKEFDENSGDFVIEEVEINPLALSNGKFYALDGVLRFKKSENKSRSVVDFSVIKSIVQPQTIAVVGVSEKKMNMARIILNNTIKAGFDREKIFVIKEGINEIDGVKAYPDFNSLPAQIDMCIVSVGVDSLIKVLEDASSSLKVNGIVLITGGVGEKSGTEEIAKKIVDIVYKTRAKNKSFGLNGGNCMGIVLNKSRVNTFFIPEYKMSYPIGTNPHMVETAFVSQSGAFVISTLTKLNYVIPDYTITVGNQQDITVVDYIDYFVNNSTVKVILSYIEGFKYRDGLRLIEILKMAKEKDKTVVLYKAGRTSLGQKAVMGHTASIAGEYIISEKLLSSAGAIVCESFDEFCDISFMATYLAKNKIKSLNSFLISNAGFETTGMADNVGNLNVKQPSASLKEKMEKILIKHKLNNLVDFKNPMDLTPMATDRAISDIVELLISSGEYDNLIISMVPLTPNLNTLKESNSYPDRLEYSFLNEISHFTKEIPVIFCVASGSVYDDYVEYAIKKGFVVFRTADRMIKVFEKYISHRLKDK